MSDEENILVSDNDTSVLFVEDAEQSDISPDSGEDKAYHRPPSPAITTSQRYNQRQPAQRRTD